MNITNFKRALEHFNQMPPEQFDFNVMMSCDLADVNSWGDDPAYTNPLNYEIPLVRSLGSCSLQALFVRYGEVPVGTKSCVAGELYLEFAQTNTERLMNPLVFARRFLGLTELQAFPLFNYRPAYGIPATDNLKLEHVVAKFEDIILRALSDG